MALLDAVVDELPQTSADLFFTLWVEIHRSCDQSVGKFTAVSQAQKNMTLCKLYSIVRNSRKARMMKIKPRHRQYYAERKGPMQGDRTNSRCEGSNVLLLVSLIADLPADVFRGDIGCFAQR